MLGIWHTIVPATLGKLNERKEVNFLISEEDLKYYTADLI